MRGGRQQKLRIDIASWRPTSLFITIRSEINLAGTILARQRSIDPEAVLDAAERVVIRDGAANLTLDAVAVEAGIRQGWDAIIGSDGVFVGMSSFGASAPYKDLYSHFGITPEAIAAAALAKFRPR